MPPANCEKYQSTVGGRPWASGTRGAIAELGQFRDVGAAALRAAGRGGAGDQLDLAAGMGRDALRELRRW